jgi:hypothetical protein
MVACTKTTYLQIVLYKYVVLCLLQFQNLWTIKFVKAHLVFVLFVKFCVYAFTLIYSGFIWFTVFQ